jgi:hypothetical protein
MFAKSWINYTSTRNPHFKSQIPGFCVDIWLNHDTKTWIPSMWCRKSHINLCSSIHTLMLQSTVRTSTLYMILGVQKRTYLVTYMPWESLWCFVGEPHSFLTSLNLLHFHLYICTTVIMRLIHIYKHALSKEPRVFFFPPPIFYEHSIEACFVWKGVNSVNCAW